MAHRLLRIEASLTSSPEFSGVFEEPRMSSFNQHGHPSIRMQSLAPTSPEIIAAVSFSIAVLHTFTTKFFAHLAHRQPSHAGLWRLLGEVEVVFGFWAFVLIAALLVFSGKEAAVRYLDERSFTEPLFVLAIMVIAASRPILQGVLTLVRATARLMPIPATQAVYFLCLFAVCVRSPKTDQLKGVMRV